MKLAGWTKHGLEAIAINPDGTDMDLNTTRAKINNNELTTGDFRYVIRRNYTEAAEREFVIEESFYFFPIQKSNID